MTIASRGVGVWTAFTIAMLLILIIGVFVAGAAKECAAKGGVYLPQQYVCLEAKVIK